MIKEAIAFFTRAKRFNHGIRLAKEHMLETELMTLALEGTKEGKVEAAKYFEEKGVMDKAVLLYQKGGRIGKALDLCFKAQLFDALRTICKHLSVSSYLS
jgi:intraflagellar transport protein 140